MNNLDIWAIEFNKKELDKALNNIKKEGTNILYTNCISEIKFGSDRYISKQYDTCLYNIENDLLVLIMRSDNKTNSKIRECLTNKNILYHEVRFIDLNLEYDEDLNIPKIWFARDKNVLKNAIINSKSKGIDICTFYPNVESQLIINYQGGKNNIPFDGRVLKGLVKLSDKYVFVINQNDPRNMKSEDVVSVLLEEGMNIYISQEKYPQELLEKEEKEVKKLCKKI